MPRKDPPPESPSNSAPANALAAPASRVDTYLTRRAQATWPSAVVYCDSDGPVPPPGAQDDARRFRLTRSGQPEVVLGEGGFRQARTALDLLKLASAEDPSRGDDPRNPRT